MCIKKCHSTMFYNPIQFSFPNLNGRFSEKNEQGRILWKRIWQLHISGLYCWILNPSWKNRVKTVWLRLKWISVEGGGIIRDIQAVQPIKIVMHETGAKARCVPFLQIVIYALRAFDECLPCLVKLAVMTQIMHSNLKAVLKKVFPQFARHCVILRFRNKVEGRAETVLHFELHQLPALVQTFPALDIMGQHKSESSAIRPPGPFGRSPFRPWQHRPDGLNLVAPSQREPAAKQQPKGGRQPRLKLIVDLVAEHYFNH